MSYPEAKYAMSFLGTAIVSAIYASRIRPLYESGYFDDPDGMMLTGRAILILIGVIVGVNILLQIVIAIAYAITSGGKDMLEDEREKQIELRALNIAFSIFGAGLLASFVALAWGRPPFEVFHLIILSMVLCGLAADAIRIWLLRRGF